MRSRDIYDFYMFTCKTGLIGLIKNTSYHTQTVFFLVGVDEQIAWSRDLQRQKKSAAMFDVPDLEEQEHWGK